MILSPKARAAAIKAVADLSADMIADLRRPRSLKGCSPWKPVVMTVVQHSVGPNSITVSHDGKIDGAWRLPLTYTNAPRRGQPIVSVLQTELEFLLISVPGWLANERDLCQALSPQLSPEIEWSEAQREAWERLRKAFLRHGAAQDKARRSASRQSKYNDEREHRNASGNFTISELVYGAPRKPR